MRPVYEEYIQSMDWVNRCRRYFGDTPMCSVRNCRRRWREGRIVIHHRTYERLGQELFADLVPLCSRCHTEAHDWAAYYAEEGIDRAAALLKGTETLLLVGGER